MKAVEDLKRLWRPEVAGAVIGLNAVIRVVRSPWHTGPENQFGVGSSTSSQAVCSTPRRGAMSPIF